MIWQTIRFDAEITERFAVMKWKPIWYRCEINVIKCLSCSTLTLCNRLLAGLRDVNLCSEFVYSFTWRKPLQAVSFRFDIYFFGYVAMYNQLPFVLAKNCSIYVLPDSLAWSKCDILTVRWFRYPSLIWPAATRISERYSRIREKAASQQFFAPAEACRTFLVVCSPEAVEVHALVEGGTITWVTDISIGYHLRFGTSAWNYTRRIRVQ